MTSARVVPIDPDTDPRWDAYLVGHPGARLAHSSPWLEVLRRTYGYTPAHLAYEVDGRVQGVLPLFLVRSALTGRRLVSLPFSGPSGPLGSTRDATAGLAHAAVRLVTELRCGYLNIQTAESPLDRPLEGFTTLRPFVSSVVSLEGGLDAVWRRIPHQTVRQEIRRARRRGVVVEMGRDRTAMDTFYGLYVQTSRKHGIPPQPTRLFRLMWDVLAPRRMIQVFLAILDGRLITAMVCFRFKDIVSAGYVGTDYRFLRYHPVRLTDWTAIEWASAQGHGSFDFLQSHVRNAGLRWYKSSFGAVERPVAYHYYPTVGSTARLREAMIGGRSTLATAARGVVRRLPGWALRLLGRAAFRHVA